MDPGTDLPGTTSRVVLDALDVYSAQEILITLRTAADLPGDLCIDLHQTTGLHAAVAQILVAAARAARAHGRRFYCVHVSPEIEETLRLAGLAGLLLADGEPVKDVS